MVKHRVIIFSVCSVILIISATLFLPLHSASSYQNPCDPQIAEINSLSATNTMIEATVISLQLTSQPTATIDPEPTTVWTEAEMQLSATLTSQQERLHQLEQKIQTYQATLNAMMTGTSADPCKMYQETLDTLISQNLVLSATLTAIPNMQATPGLETSETTISPTDLPTQSVLPSPTPDPNSIFFVDFETEQIGILGLPANITIENGLLVNRSTNELTYALLPLQIVNNSLFLEFDTQIALTEGMMPDGVIVLGAISPMGDHILVKFDNEFIEVYQTQEGVSRFVTSQYSFIDPTHTFAQMQHVGILLENAKLTVFVNDQLTLTTPIDIEVSQIALGAEGVGIVFYDHVNVRPQQ